MKPALHPDETDRLRELHRYGILDTEREREFDELVEIASVICDAPVSVVNFIDEGRQWFKAEVGLGVRSTPLETSLCGHVILQGDFVEIPDTLEDARMADNPLCTSDPGFRFYAGAVLKGGNGLPLGTLCILDHKPRTLTDHQRKVLRVLSRHIMRELDLRLALEQEQTLRREVDHRMKNSLASVGALLSMKAMREKDAAVRHALEDASNLVRSISSLHAELHEIGGNEQVNLRSLFGRIEADLSKLLPDGVTLRITVGDDAVTPKLANALVLIVNEFVSNSIKHAFGTGSGSIRIAIAGGGKGWTILCRDDGSATEQDAQRAAAGSGLGTQVIQSLASSMGTTAFWRADGSGMELEIGFTDG
ncbi:histidine kinase dimerization/phosphoacceptor domain -containing protein [Porphyrobacter sp. YT40]|uniref:histidine kinase dimerization/phosphoacceptor domain -containing protein n=1 Tax=Porphyrobacter sp. YT40 TaxID=2547601 RepID=UPI001142A603|nr:histidine kinase dimerization/phosphoacceptor domain -containing protein [Porphyrobacter sp. YT40]QDH33816.1 GAF domain-containing protein [Porphyrobacter sp. YT40]